MTITFEELEREVRRLAEENYNFVYLSPDDGGRGCYYTRGRDPESPGCIWGRAILSLDPSLQETLAVYDSSSIVTLLDTLCINVEDLEEAWAERVQEWQDNGTPWGIAIKKADEGELV